VPDVLPSKTKMVFQTHAGGVLTFLSVVVEWQWVGVGGANEV